MKAPASLNFLQRYFLQRYSVFFTHLSAWALLLSLPFWFGLGPGFRPKPPPPEMESSIFPFLFIGLFVVIFYVNYYLLIPKLLNRQGIQKYLFGLVAVWAASGTVFIILKKTVQPATSDDLAPFFFSLFPFALAVAVGLSIHLVGEKLRAEREQKERENETLKTELSFLRSQISPHFLFNIINNVVGMSRVEPALVEPTLIKLSELIRYMIYESDESKVSLQREINYLTAYIDLQKMRLGDAVPVRFMETGATAGRAHLLIEPMLLIPFVENAFKHGVGVGEKPFIYIIFELQGKTLTFKVENAYNPEWKSSDADDSGVGLRNVARRLNLLYGARHTLQIRRENAVFSVVLTVQLSDAAFNRI